MILSVQETMNPTIFRSDLCISFYSWFPLTSGAVFGMVVDMDKRRIKEVKVFLKNPEQNT
jgi:hypothetical protein